MGQTGKAKQVSSLIRPFLLVLAVVTTLIVAGVNLVIANTKHVTINDDGNITYVKTLTATVEELLQEQDITLMDEDDVQPLPETKLEKEQEIIIKRAVPVTVFADGKEIALKTCKETVGEALQEADVRVDIKDITNYQLSDAILAGMKINIVRVVETIDTVTEKIAFEIVDRANEKMDKGNRRVVQKGADGEKKKQYLVVKHDGKEVSRALMTEEVVKKPINQINEYGTVAVHKTSRGETFRYKKMLNMRATAYDLSYESCGKHPDHPHYGITYTGMKARYGVVAVDPRTIPLHSRLYIEAADGSWVYGNAIAGDIGGAVKGDIIDLFYDDEEFTKKFGVRRVKVYILE